MKKTLKTMLVLGALTLPFVPLAINKYKIANKIAEKIEYSDGVPGVSKEDVDSFYNLYNQTMTTRGSIFHDPWTGKYFFIPFSISELDFVNYPIKEYQFREHLVRSLPTRDLKTLSEKTYSKNK